MATDAKAQGDDSPLSISAWADDTGDFLDQGDETPGKAGEGRGLWTRDEHQSFLRGIQMHHQGPWKVIAAQVGSRTARQTMTHAQKYRQKIARRLRNLRANGPLPLPGHLDASSPRYNALLSNDEQFSDSIIATALAIEVEMLLDRYDEHIAMTAQPDLGGFDASIATTEHDLAFEECIDFLIAQYQNGAPLP